MVPESIALILAIIRLTLYAIVGLAIGELSGWLISLITKCGPTGVWVDAVLGAFGAVVGFLGCAFVPWPRNTVATPLLGGGKVETTMSSYQHPERVAIVMAVVLPLMYEMYRLKRANRNESL